ncbi:hypothetical protein VTO42DRAFT_3308 [Malbranchea cinnamomea]
MPPSLPSWRKTPRRSCVTESDASEDPLVSSQIMKDPYPYYFPQQGSSGADLFPMPLCDGFKLEEASIDEIQAQMSKGKLTSEKLVQCCHRRIHQTNWYLNAILQLNPDAPAVAKALDEERARGHVRSPLHGIPFVVKDNMGTRDRMETTAGSWALLGSVVPRDAHVVYQLRKAGAVLLGKASMSEWADMRSTKYSEGYSPRGGQCRSAYNLTTNPGSSSSGSAVAVGANLVSFALGTETDGSVINPAHKNSIVGFKPTFGLTSRAGVIPESHNLDSIGTFGKTVRDATYALDAIYGIDNRDSYTHAQEGKTPLATGGYSQYLSDKSALKDAVFGLPSASFWAKGVPSQNAKLHELLDLIKSAGATIINDTEITNHETIVSANGWDWDWGTTRGCPNESEYTFVKVDFYNNLKAYLSTLENTRMRSLEDIIQYNLDNYATEGGHPGVHPAFESGQDSFLAALETKGIMDETYWQALNFCRTSARKGIDDALHFRHPMHNPFGRPLAGLLVPTDAAQTYQIAAQAGYPMITIPAGMDKETGIPYSLSIMNTAFSEAQLVRHASAIEDLQIKSGTPHRRTLPEWRGHMVRNLPVIR